MSVPSPSPEVTGRALAAPVWGIHFLDWLGRICLSAVPAHYSVFTSNFPFLHLTYYIFYCILDIFRDTAFLDRDVLPTSSLHILLFRVQFKVSIFQKAFSDDLRL